MNHLLDALIQVEDHAGAAELDIDGNIGHGRGDAVVWLVTYLETQFPDNFACAMEALGIIQPATFSPEECQAIMDEANVGVRAFRVFRQYLASKSETGRQKVFASEGSIRKLGSDDPVPPTFQELDIDGEKIKYWFKMMNVVLSKRLPERYDQSWRQLIFTLGADHGAQAEQLGVKVDAYSDASGDPVYSDVFRLGEIECKTETSEILLEALAKHLNAAIDEMLKEGVNAEGEGPDGLLKFSLEKSDNDRLPPAVF